MSAENSGCDPVSIDAVAAAIGDVWEVFDAGLNEDGFPERGMRTRSPESIARALDEAGWLRTAEDRAVLDAAEALRDAYYRGGDNGTAWTRFDDAVRARRVAAGGTTCPYLSPNGTCRVSGDCCGAAGGTVPTDPPEPCSTCNDRGLVWTSRGPDDWDSAECPVCYPPTDPQETP